MRPYVLKFHPCHLKAISGEITEPFLRPFLEGNMDAVGKALAEGGFAVTGICEEGIIGCGGVVETWQGTGKAWAIFGELIKFYPKFVTQMSLTVIRHAMQSKNLKRVETAVAGNIPQNLKWAHLLGFREEGVLRKYYNGQDFRMVAIVDESD
jgi:hypothetical protein